MSDKIQRGTSWLQLLRRRALGALGGVAALSAAGGCYWLVGRFPPEVALPWCLVLILGVAGIIGTAHHLWSWRLPLRRMRTILGLIRRGQAPIDELSRITGPMGCFRATVQDMLRELRQAKVDLAICQHETRQLVAQRTDALERLVGSLRQQANRDALTGLYNRRMLDQHLPAIVKRCRDEQADLCLLMLDLDNFKALNDTLGHAAGDELLRSVGQLIRSSIREQDLGFRCGGDEFVIVLPDHGFAVGHALGRRLSCLVDELGRTMKTPQPLGLSVGLVSLSEIGEGRADWLLLEADKRLYATKAARKSAKRTAA